ncbi:MAG: hypothetical protein AAF561_02250 [Planctomycetota bacterium]
MIDAKAAAMRAWSAELCVRCRAVSAVVVDGRGFDLTMTRRLQLGVRETSCRLIVLRPSAQGGVSAAGTRWRVEPVPAVRDDATGDSPRRPRWSVALVRSKGGHHTTNGVSDRAGRRPADLLTAREMFCDELRHFAETTGFGAQDWTFEWNAETGVARPVEPALADESASWVGIPLRLPADLVGGPPPPTAA